MNELLRSHVTRVGFNLQLSKTQIAALIKLDTDLADPRPFNEAIRDPSGRIDNPGRHILSNSVAALGALVARGLVVHYRPRDGVRDTLNNSLRDTWAITDAGHSVIALLKEAGLWDEVTAEIPYRQPPAERPPYTPQDEIAHLRKRLAEAEGLVVEARAETSRQRAMAQDADRAKWRAESALSRLQDRVRGVVELVGDPA
jgi:hypothetical protein